MSSLHETKPVGGPDQDDYLNAAAEIETELQPYELLAITNGIEDACGRERTVRWGPRTLDIDILMMGDLVMSDEQLTLPHPRMAQREFVLAPLAEIAPRAVHPTTGRDISALLAALRTPEADCSTP